MSAEVFGDGRRKLLFEPIRDLLDPDDGGKAREVGDAQPSLLDSRPRSDPRQRRLRRSRDAIARELRACQRGCLPAPAMAGV